MKSIYVLTIDVGTTGAKTCLFNITDKMNIIASAMSGYKLYTLENGGVEQDPNEWWSAICDSIHNVLNKSNIQKEQIEGISFCSQMQGLVLVDKNGNPVRRAMSYLDQRAFEQHKKGIVHGIKIAGLNAKKLITSLFLTGAVSASIKDPVWKYIWVKENEPEIFRRVYKWLDVKDYLVLRCTDKFKMTHGSAFATLLYNTRKKKKCWSKTICKMFGVNMSHLPDIINSTDNVGGLTPKAANELGLVAGTPVFGGGGDAELIGVGSGYVNHGDTHIYIGTSGWVSTVINKQKVDLQSKIAGIVGARQEYFNYFAEMETSGKCLEWVKNHLALDEIGVYLEKKNVTESIEKIYTTLYDYLCEVISKAPAGSNGVIFTPWLHGNRCPFEDPYAKGMFFNIGLDTGKTLMIRSVVEGICFHKKWMLEAQEKKVKTSTPIMFVGGGALSPVICQILADILGREVVTIPNPQNVGALGAAVIVAIGLKVISSFDETKNLIHIKHKYIPNSNVKEIYDRNYQVFKNLYSHNKINFEKLNKK